MQAGTMLGEVAFLLNAASGASVVAASDCELAVVSAAGLEELRRDDPGAATEFDRLITVHVAEKLDEVSKRVATLSQ